MSFRRVKAIFKKQVKDTLKNKTVLIQFIMLPILAYVMTKALSTKDVPKTYFVTLFATMYIGMAPLSSIANIISEEKEKNSLTVLIMANVKPSEYLLGVGAYVFAICSMGVLVFGKIAGYTGNELFRFVFVLLIGILASLLIGAAIGMYSKNQMSASSISVPTATIFSFLPMIGAANKNVEKVSKFIYTQQINYLIKNLNIDKPDYSKFAVIGLNMIIFVIAFIYAYKKEV